MIKVLIISYNFPPRSTIGSQRPYRISKYLPQYGWEPIVLTASLPGRPPEGIRVIETDFKDTIKGIKSKAGFNTEETLHEQLGIAVSKDYNYPTIKSKVIKMASELIAFPDKKKGWYEFALQSATKLLSKEKVDIIISTSAPVTSHLIAKKLKKDFKIPWIADLRDLWTQNHFYNKFKVIKYFEKNLELRTLSDADALVTVTEKFRETLTKLHRGKRVFCITNGFDTDDFLETSTKLTSKFSITHTGQLCDGRREPFLLFEVISKLISENAINKELIDIRFYGPRQSWISNDIEKYNLNGVVSFGGFIHREEALERQKESQLLLLLLDKDNNEKDVYPAKVFEYFGARRPILAIGGREGIIKGLIAETSSGKFAENHEILKNVILKYYWEFINLGEVQYCGNGSIENYTYRSIAKKYSEVLNGFVNYEHSKH